MSRAVTGTRSDERIRVLLVADNPDFTETVAECLKRQENFDMITRTDPEAAIEVLEAERIEAIISDFQMSRMDGIALLKRVRRVQSDLPFFLFTDGGNESVASAAISAGVTDYITKRTGTKQYAKLADKVREAVRNRHRGRSTRENEQFLQAVFDGVRNGMAVVDAEMDIVRVNEWFTKRAAEQLVGRKYYEVLTGQESPPEDCPVREALKTGERQRTEMEITTFGEPFWADIEVDPLPPVVDGGDGVLLQLQDLTECKRRERKLEKREQMFRTVHEQTDRCLAASSREELFGHVLDMVSQSLPYARASVLGYDTTTGRLTPVARTDAFEAELGRLQAVGPGEGPLWEAFHAGSTGIIEGSQLMGTAENDFVAVPLGDYGLLLAHRDTTVDFPRIDIEQLELCAANATAILDRLRKEGELGSASNMVSAQADRIETLQSFLDAFRQIHQAMADAETRSKKERAVVSELVAAELADFAWIGRPKADAEAVEPTTWAGQDAGFLDAVDLGPSGDLLPAQRAAKERRPITVSNITEKVQQTSWAKEALSLGFRSVAAFPIEIDGVLYGVLSVYSSESGRLNAAREGFLGALTASIASQIRGQNRHDGGVNHAAVELEFTAAGSNRTLHSLAAKTGVRLQFERVLDATESSVRILVTVPEDTDEGFPLRASTLRKVLEASWFGSRDNSMVALELDRPFVGTGVKRHGGTLEAMVADGSETTIRIRMPMSRQQRPLMEWLQETYNGIDLKARRDPAPEKAARLTVPSNLLTERQTEILEAAHAGGYFETPRTISGEELAENFDISDSAVYKHLRAAQKRLLDRLSNTSSEN